MFATSYVHAKALKMQFYVFLVANILIRLLVEQNDIILSDKINIV